MSKLFKIFFLWFLLTPSFGLGKIIVENKVKKAKSLCSTELETKFIPAPHLKKLEYHTEHDSPAHTDYEDEDDSSSFLLSEVLPNSIASMAPGKRDSELLKWCSNYSAKKLSDGDPQTAWCEGVEGYGIDEIVLADLYLNPGDNVEIWSGLGKKGNLFHANNRPKKVKVFVILEICFLGLDPDVRRLIPIAEQTVELNDINGFQVLKVPKFSDPIKVIKHPSGAVRKELDIKVKNMATDHYKDAMGFSHSFKLGIQILSVYPGERFNDTCISEIRFKK